MRISDWSSDVCSSDLDETARYLFVGRLYDMEERRDVTAARLLELNPDLLAAGAARVASDAPAGRDEAPVQAGASHVDLSSLPAAGAIHWGNPKGEQIGRASCRERVCQYV